MSDYRARYRRIWVIRTCRGRCSDMWLWNKKESVLFHSLLARNKVRNGINLVFIALWWIMMIRHSERNLNCHIGYGLIKGKQSRTCFRTVFATCLNQDCWFYFSVVLRCWFSLMKSGLGLVANVALPSNGTWAGACWATTSVPYILRVILAVTNLETFPSH